MNSIYNLIFEHGWLVLMVFRVEADAARANWFKDPSSLQLLLLWKIIYWKNVIQVTTRIGIDDGYISSWLPLEAKCYIQNHGCYVYAALQFSELPSIVFLLFIFRIKTISSIQLNSTEKLFITLFNIPNFSLGSRHILLLTKFHLHKIWFKIEQPKFSCHK